QLGAAERDHVVERLGLVSRLTAAQFKVARLVAQCMTNAEIARSLVLSKGTVERQMEEIYRQLDLNKMQKEERGLEPRAILIKTICIYMMDI
ncbi:MAG: hypothetical protein JNL42_06720, partial [Anaerolineae bacterium]|nr:hypothetical protein [Anaerolineae bacterium]